MLPSFENTMRWLAWLKDQRVALVAALVKYKWWFLVVLLLVVGRWFLLDYLPYRSKNRILTSQVADLAGTKNELQSDVTDLRGKLAEKNAKIGELERELTPFRTAALQRYGSTDFDAMRKLFDHLTNVDAKLTILEAEVSKMPELQKRLETSEGRIKYRELSGDQIERLRRLFEGVPKGPLVVTMLGMDLEASHFAQQLEGEFKLAGYTVSRLTLAAYASDGDVPTGVIVQVRNKESIPTHADGVFSALKEIGVKVSPQTDITLKDGTVGIFVGVRPNPE